MQGGEPLEVLRTGRSAVVVVDGTGTLLFANDAASVFLAKDPSCVEGTPCWKAVGLRTLDGRPFCAPSCPLWQNVQAGSPEQLHHLAYRSPTGVVAEIHLFSSHLSAPRSKSSALLHLILPISSGAERRAVGRSVDGTAAADRPVTSLLTRRETEVLQLLTAGHTPAAIADRLFISRITVRNHMQNVMRKLGVHRRLDAVVAWMKSATPH